MIPLRDVGELLFGTDVGDFSVRRRVWSARRAQPTAASELVVGQRAKVAGIARQHEHVIAAPFSKRPALAYRVKLFEKMHPVEPQGTDMPAWRLLFTDAHAMPFVIESEGARGVGTGNVLVDARSAILKVLEHELNEHPHVNDDNPDFRAYLRRKGVISTMYMGIAREHRFFEAIVAPGERVAVWGMVSESTGVANAGYRDVATQTKIISGSRTDPCVVLAQ